MYRSTGRAGSPLPMPVTVQNLENRPQEITLLIQAVQYTDGNYSPQLDKKSKFDCSDWFPQKEFKHTIGALSDYKVPLKCNIPKGTEPGVYYCIGKIDPTADPSSPNKIRAQYQIPLIILVGSLPKLDLKFGTPQLVNTDKLCNVLIPFVNDSDAFAVIGATVQLRNVVTRRLIDTKADSDRNLYPRTRRTLNFVFSHLPDGEYMVQSSTQANLKTYRPIAATFVVSKGKASAVTPEMQVSLPPFTMEPPLFHMEKLTPGSSRVQSIKITNLGATPLSISLSLHRLTQSSNGLPQVQEDAQLGLLGVELSTDKIAIQPRNVATVRVKVTAAAGTKGDKWFAISAISDAKDSMSQEVYGILRMPGGVPGLEITPGEIGKVDGVPLSIDFEVANTGDIALKPQAIAILLLGGITELNTLAIPPLGDGGILPGAILHNKVMLPPDLKPGAYTVKISYQYAEDKDQQPISAVKQIAVIVPPRKPAPPKKKGKSGGGV